MIRRYSKCPRLSASIGRKALPWTLTLLNTLNIRRKYMEDEEQEQEHHLESERTLDAFKATMSAYRFAMTSPRKSASGLALVARDHDAQAGTSGSTTSSSSSIISPLASSPRSSSPRSGAAAMMMKVERVESSSTVSRHFDRDAMRASRTRGASPDSRADSAGSPGRVGEMKIRGSKVKVGVKAKRRTVTPTVYADLKPLSDHLAMELDGGWVLRSPFVSRCFGVLITS